MRIEQAMFAVPSNPCTKQQSISAKETKTCSESLNQAIWIV